MPVSLAIIFGENKTNRQLAASPTSVGQLTRGISGDTPYPPAAKSG